MADSFYTDKRDKLVAPLLARYGAPVILKRTSGQTFNTVTGEVTGGSVAKTTVNGVVLSQKTTEQDSVAKAELTLFLDASTLTTAPTTSDRVSFGNKDYELVAVDPIAPGGIAVAYQIRVREP